MGKNVIIACDFSSREETLSFLDKMGKARPYVKIGMELFYAAGPDMVRELKDRGHQVFLDLKLHDIPHTVQRAMAVLSCLGADILNLHAAGTRDMMEAALEGAVRPDGSRPLLIAVTQLTSTSEERMKKELLIDATLPETVTAYAQNARLAGLDGVVCSPLEAASFTAPAAATSSPSRLACALPTAVWTIRCGWPRRSGPKSLVRTISWWAVPSPRPPILSQPGSVVCGNSSINAKQGDR